MTKLSWRQNAIFTLPKIYKTQSVTKLYLGQHSNCAKTQILPKLKCNWTLTFIKLKLTLERIAPVICAAGLFLTDRVILNFLYTAVP